MSSVIVQAGEIQDYNGSETAPLLRRFLTKTIIASDGDTIMRSSYEEGDFYGQDVCSAVGGVVSYPQHTIDSLDDALSNTEDSRYNYALYTAAGDFIQIVWKNLYVRASPSTTTLGDLAEYTDIFDNLLETAPDGAYTTTQTDTLLDGKVSKTGNETVAGIKTFSSSPVVPTPTVNGQAANKSYVDAHGNVGLSLAISQGNFNL